MELEVNSEVMMQTEPHNTTMENLKDALVDLYLKVKVRSSEEIENYNSSQMQVEKRELEDTSGIVLIEYIRQNVEILLNIKSDQDENSVSEHEKSLAYPEFFSQASSIMSHHSKLNTEGYEKIIQKLEGDVRNHIRSEQQLKIYAENLLEKVDNTKEKLTKAKSIIKKLEHDILSQKDLKATMLQHEENALK